MIGIAVAYKFQFQDFNKFFITIIQAESEPEPDAEHITGIADAAGKENNKRLSRVINCWHNSNQL